MFALIFVCAGLFLFGVLIGSFAFIPGVRDLPRWIRIAQTLVGIAFAVGGAVGIGIYSSGDRLSRQMHQFLVLQVVFVVGMGLGILLLLFVSGEYFRALRELDAAHKRRLSDESER